MYIRRKVFSVAVDQLTGEEKLFSTTEILSEEAYQKQFSLDPVTGEAISPKKYKERVAELGGTTKKGEIVVNKNGMMGLKDHGKLKLTKEAKENIAAQQKANQAAAKAQYANKQAVKKVAKSAEGKLISKKAFEAGKKAGAKGMIGKGKAGLIAGGAAALGAAAGIGGAKVASKKAALKD